MKVQRHAIDCAYITLQTDCDCDMREVTLLLHERDHAAQLNLWRCKHCRGVYGEFGPAYGLECLHRVRDALDNARRDAAEYLRWLAGGARGCGAVALESDTLIAAAATIERGDYPQKSTGA